jgi:hypothetical protein
MSLKCLLITFSLVVQKTLKQPAEQSSGKFCGTKEVLLSDLVQSFNDLKPNIFSTKILGS